MKILSSLKGFTADYSEKNGVVSVNIVDSEGERLFEILHCCEPIKIDHFRNPLYIGIDSIPKFVARSVRTGEEILLFDGAVHGYDAMFCNSHTDEELRSRIMKAAEFPPSEIKIELFYEIDYEDEKDGYDFDENGNCILLDGSVIPWEQVKNNGIDSIALYYKNAEDKWIEFAEEELA